MYDKMREEFEDWAGEHNNFWLLPVMLDGKFVNYYDEDTANAFDIWQASRAALQVNSCAGMADPAAEIAELKALSVKNILLDVTPGDGSGLEVYAKSTADVSDLLCKMDEEIAELKRQRDELLGLVKAVSYHSIPATVDGIKCAAFPWSEYESMVKKAKGSAS